jgi:hypothetical protein
LPEREIMTGFEEALAALLGTWQQDHASTSAHGRRPKHP